jgi:hypothetical protein
MLISEIPIKDRLAEVSDYIGAVFVSSRAIRALDDFREGRTPADEAINSLNELKKYFRSDNSCFLDYLQIKERTSDKDYAETIYQINLALENAEQELKTRKSGSGIDDIIRFADDLGAVFLSQAWSVAA